MWVKELPDLKVADLRKEYKSSFIDRWESFDRDGKHLKTKLLNEALEVERTQFLCRESYERRRNESSYRNGYWNRYILLKEGRLRLRMPRLRGIRYKSEIIARYKQRTPDVDRALLNIFLYGASTRLTGQALYPLLGVDISAQTVSNIAKSLDIEVKRYHSRPLNDEYLYLFLDAIVLKTRTGFGAKKKTVLAAYGIRMDGVRELIDFQVVKQESESTWMGFLNRLYERGLTGEALGLVVTDGNAGLENAVDIVYSGTKRQRCWAHKLRNVSDVLKKSQQEECIKGARIIYSSKNRREAIRAWQEWSKAWRKTAPKAVTCIEKDLEELLNFYCCPPTIWKKVRTTNVIERSFREVRRRTRPMSCFNNDASIERVVYAVFNRLNSNWRTMPLLEFTQKY
ncbi:MAG: IS256 family transposase [Nitrospirota bacterium]